MERGRHRRADARIRATSRTVKNTPARRHHRTCLDQRCELAATLGKQRIHSSGSARRRAFGRTAPAAGSESSPARAGPSGAALLRLRRGQYLADLLHHLVVRRPVHVPTCPTGCQSPVSDLPAEPLTDRDDIPGIDADQGGKVVWHAEDFFRDPRPESRARRKVCTCLSTKADGRRSTRRAGPAPIFSCAPASPGPRGRTRRPGRH